MKRKKEESPPPPPPPKKIKENTDDDNDANIYGPYDIPKFYQLHIIKLNVATHNT